MNVGDSHYVNRKKAEEERDIWRKEANVWKELAESRLATLLAIREEFRSGSGGYDGDPVERMVAAALGIPEETSEAVKG